MSQAQQRNQRPSLQPTTPAAASPSADGRTLGTLELRARTLRTQSAASVSNQTSAPEATIIENTTLGDYRLLRKLASGGMAEIYLACAKDDETSRFAIKVLRPSVSNDPEFRTMLANEAKLATSIRHQNVCRVYSHGKDGDRVYMVMEYIEGMSFSHLLRTMQRNKCRFALDQTLALFVQACDGLGEAHRQASGIIHRDIAPDNILVSMEGVVKLCDFGISKAEWISSQTRAGTIKGKWRYMSPEQATGKSLDIRTDVFSLGIVLFELLTCRPLFRRATDLATHQAIVSGDIPSVKTFREVPDSIAAVLEKALQRDREKRYASASELAEAVRNAAREIGPLPGAPNLSRLLRRIQNIPEAGNRPAPRSTAPQTPNALRNPRDTTPSPAPTMFPASKPNSVSAEECTVITSEDQLRELHEQSSRVGIFEDPTVVTTPAIVANQWAACPPTASVPLASAEESAPAPAPELLPLSMTGAILELGRNQLSRAHRLELACAATLMTAGVLSQFF